MDGCKIIPYNFAILKNLRKLIVGGNGPTSSSRKRKEPPTGGASRSGRDPCDISFTTPLAHVRTAHTASLSVGTLLDVTIEIVSGKKTVVCKRKNGGEIVGFVLVRGASQLIECIEQDNIYVAEVKKADFGHVEVTIARSA